MRQSQHSLPMLFPLVAQIEHKLDEQSFLGGKIEMVIQLQPFQDLRTKLPRSAILLVIPQYAPADRDQAVPYRKAAHQVLENLQQRVLIHHKASNRGAGYKLRQRRYPEALQLVDIGHLQHVTAASLITLRPGVRRLLQSRYAQLRFWLFEKTGIWLPRWYLRSALLPAHLLEDALQDEVGLMPEPDQAKGGCS